MLSLDVNASTQTIQTNQDDCRRLQERVCELALIVVMSVSEACPPGGQTSGVPEDVMNKLDQLGSSQFHRENLYIKSEE